MKLKTKNCLILGSLLVFLGITGYFTHINPTRNLGGDKNNSNNANNLLENNVVETSNHDMQSKKVFREEKPEDCPDGWYINKMPSYDNSYNRQPYIIKDGIRSYSFDESWLRNYCGMEIEELY